MAPRMVLGSESSDDFLPFSLVRASRSESSEASGAPRLGQRNVPINIDRRRAHHPDVSLPALPPSSTPSPRTVPSDSPLVPPHTQQPISALRYSSPPARTRAQHSGPFPVPSAPATPAPLAPRPPRRESAGSPHFTAVAAAPYTAIGDAVALDVQPYPPSAAYAAIDNAVALDVQPYTPPPPQTRSGRTTSPRQATGPREPGHRVFTRPPSVMNSQPLLRDDEWRKHKEATVRIGPNLSKNVAIVDIYRLLKGFGTMETIELVVNLENERIGVAIVRFSEIFHPFWETGHFDFDFGPTRVTYLKPREKIFVPGKVDSSKIFPATIDLKAKSLDFGFMLRGAEFMAMFTTKPEADITWKLNVIRKKFELIFSLRIEKPDLVKDDRPEPSRSAAGQADGAFDRTQLFMVEVPFSQLRELFMPDEDQHTTERTFVIPLLDPPRYYRQLNEWSASMADRSLNRWSIYDVWMRQTDIEYDMKARKLHPIGLGNRHPVVDIGRWTTFRLSFSLNRAKTQGDFETMLDILRDYNVRLLPLTTFQVSRDRSSLSQIWPYLDNRAPPVNTRLSFAIRYQLEVCISHGFLNEYNILPEFVERLASFPEPQAIAYLGGVVERKTRVFDPMQIFTLPLDKRADSSASIPDTCIFMRRATVTPTNILFQTPNVEMSNRVVRHFHQHSDRFLRVSFTDEKPNGRIRFNDKLTSNELFSRAYRTLEKGILLGDRCYEFLAFGNSQLREHGAYFFASFDGMSAAKIRHWMGDFSAERVIAKHSARLGQCFSTTKAFNSCDVVCRTIPDIQRNGYKFSDGVGTMSPKIAHLLTEDMLRPRRLVSSNYLSSCFQFRLGGCKGVLAVDPNVPGLEICLRPGTQKKFWSNHNKLEIIRCSQFASASLNRQLIQVMSTLGVSDDFFRQRLENILSDYMEAISNPAKALELLTKHIDPNQMTLAIANLVRAGLQDSKEPFVMSLMHLWRAWTIKYLKEKAKIIIDDGAFLLGVVDETAKLRGYYIEKPDELPQIFCQVSHPVTGLKKVITGRCVVARNPSLHPGDVRIVEAIDIPELHHLVDVVAFPQTGDRDVPNMLSGGDLDGDDYVVIWDEGLVAPGVIENEPPANYTPPKPEELGRNVDISDVRKFFVDYMKNDRLGSIANAHLAWADKLSEGVKSNMCIELANLHSDAVDYPKSGIKARMQKKHRIRDWPHFFDKPLEEGQYRSTKILGQLYDMVERVDFTPCYGLEPSEVLLGSFELSEDELREAKELKADYDAAINRIMAQHSIQTEFEVWSTFVMSHSNSNDYKFHEEIGELSFALKARFRKKVMGSCTDMGKELPRKVAAMYVVTASQIQEAKESLQARLERQVPRNKGLRRPLTKAEIDEMPLMSFPWIFADILINLTRGKLEVSRYYTPEHADICLEDPDLPIEDIDIEEFDVENEGDTVDATPAGQISFVSPADAEVLECGESDDEGGDEVAANSDTATDSEATVCGSEAEVVTYDASEAETTAREDAADAVAAAVAAAAAAAAAANPDITAMEAEEEAEVVEHGAVVRGRAKGEGKACRGRDTPAAGPDTTDDEAARGGVAVDTEMAAVPGTAAEAVVVKDGAATETQG